MPSPFPGMDPFLEHPDVFPDVHDSLTTTSREYLQARLPEPYYAVLGSRVWVEVSQRFIGPDVHVRRREEDSTREQKPQGAVAVATPPRTIPVRVTVPDDERREAFVEIYARKDASQRLVTTIEILSLTNKTPGEHGRDLYRRKQAEILKSKVHLVEIDLLRGGEHTTAVPRDDAIAKSGEFDYHVSVHHFDKPKDYFVYPIKLQESLPEIAIPLLPGDGTVPLDLQAILDRVYDAGPYRRWVRYEEMALVPPLPPDQLDWAMRCLREKGILVAAPG